MGANPSENSFLISLVLPHTLQERAKIPVRLAAEQQRLGPALPFPDDLPARAFVLFVVYGRPAAVLEAAFAVLVGAAARRHELLAHDFPGLGRPFRARPTAAHPADLGARTAFPTGVDGCGAIGGVLSRRRRAWDFEGLC